jgi:hypothetical protein
LGEINVSLLLVDDVVLGAAVDAVVEPVDEEVVTEMEEAVTSLEEPDLNMDAPVGGSEDCLLCVCDLTPVVADDLSPLDSRLCFLFLVEVSSARAVRLPELELQGFTGSSTGRGEAGGEGPRETLVVGTVKDMAAAKEDEDFG